MMLYEVATKVVKVLTNDESKKIMGGDGEVIIIEDLNLM